MRTFFRLFNFIRFEFHAEHWLGCFKPLIEGPLSHGCVLGAYCHPYMLAPLPTAM